MKMFKILSKTALLTFLMMAIVFVACKKDDPTPDPVVDKNEIVGKWTLTSITPETAGTNIPALALIQQNVPCIYSLTLTFTSDNKVTPADCDVAIQALAATGYLTINQATTWKVENSTLKLTNGSASQTLPLKQNTNEMTITVNTETDLTKPAVNVLLLFKRQ